MIDDHSGGLSQGGPPLAGSLPQRSQVIRKNHGGNDRDPDLGQNRNGTDVRNDADRHGSEVL